MSNARNDLFPPTSRYYGNEVVTASGDSRPPVQYLRRRFLPDPASLAFVRRYVVDAGDRLDNVTHACLGDPEQFWRLCDANGAMRPQDLVAEPGRALRVTLPQGMPGPKNA